MSGGGLAAMRAEEAIAGLAVRWNLTQEMARQRWQHESGSMVELQPDHQTARRPGMPHTGPITFTPGEVSTYYEVRVPHLKQRRAAEWRGDCPIHHGKNDNFAVEPETGQWFCHSACRRGGDILELEAALIGGDFPTRKAEVFRIVGRAVPTNGNGCGTQKASAAWRVVARYNYTDESGAPLFRVIRRERGEGAAREKTFHQERFESGRWITGLASVRRVPYHLSEVVQANRVFMAEGEQDCETLRAWGLTASTNPMGAGKWSSDYSDHFAGKCIVVIPDADGPGRAHAAEVAATLLPVASSVHVLELPGLPPKGDVTDWRDAGGTFERFRELTEAAAPMDAAALSELRVRWGLADEERDHPAARAEAADDWPKPVPFLRRDTPALPADLLPGFLGDMASATARATETPLELAALLGLAVVAASVARKVIVCPELGYIEPVNIYAAVAMESGNRKTAVLNRMTRPFMDWEVSEAHRLKPEISRIASERKTQEARIESLRKKAAKSANHTGLMAQVAEMELSLPEVPNAPRLWTQDVTPERLGALMAEQGERIALLSDEGGIFDVLAGRYSKGVPNLDLFLQAHAGAAVRVDRGSRPHVMLRNPALTVAISPQPDVLESLSDKPGFRGRGLLARFLYGLPVSPIGFRELKPAPCPSAVEKAYCAGIERLLRLAPPMDEDGNWQPWQLTFSPRAYQAWKEFQRAIEILMREGGKLYYLKDWGSKLPGAAVRIAGALHCVVLDPTESTVISEDTIDRVLNLVTPLMDHTLAVFNLMERDKISEDAQKVMAWIRKQGEPSFTVRDSFCAHQSRFKTMDAIRPPLSLLEQHYCIRPRPKEKVSYRPSEVYDVNPKVLEASA